MDSRIGKAVPRHVNPRNEQTTTFRVADGGAEWVAESLDETLPPKVSRAAARRVHDARDARRVGGVGATEAQGSRRDIATIEIEDGVGARVGCGDDEGAARQRAGADQSAIRTAKSDLGLRPIFHHLESRVDAHILVCFLALALWRSLEQWMSAKGLGSSTRKLIDAISTLKNMDVFLPVERAGVRIELRLRVIAKPEGEAAQLLARLGLQIPRQSKLVENVVPKMT